MASWLFHDNFNQVLKECWAKDRVILENIDKFTSKIKILNKETFGDIFRKKNRLLSRLEGISRKLSFQDSSYLERLHADLWKEYE